MIILDGLALPKGLFFRDDIAYTPIRQRNIKSSTGKTIILRGTVQDGRAITLTGSEKSNSLTRLQLQQIAAKRGSLDPMDLVIDNVTYKVHFDLSATDHLTAKPLWKDTVSLSDESLFYIEKLMFIEIKA